MANNSSLTGCRSRLQGLKEKARLHGDEAKHEQTDSWSNRDLIPLPPERRTWSERFSLKSSQLRRFANICLLMQIGFSTSV